MRKLLFLITLSILTLLVLSCIKDSDELVFDNPLDQSGTNWHTPIIDEVSFSDSSIPINDTILFTVKADPEKQHDPMDSAFIYDLKTFEKSGTSFEGGYAIIPIVKEDSGTYNIEYWISDNVGRKTERTETSFRVDLYPPEIYPRNDWSVPSGQELPIDMSLFSGDHNGNVEKYFYKTEVAQDFIEQTESEIYPSWTISDESLKHYSRTLYLKVMDDDGLTTETEVPVTISRIKPQINNFNLPPTASNSIQIHVSVEATDDDNDITTYKWAIGKDAPNADFKKETSDPGFDTTFSEEGTYTIRVMCVDAGGVESDVVEKTVIVSQDSGEKVTITKDMEVSSPIPAGTKINFQVSANPAELVKSFLWTITQNDAPFEEFTTPTGERSYTFNEPGEYSVKISANGVASDTAEFIFTVDGNEVKPTVQIVSPSEDPVIRFRDQSLDVSLATDNMDGGIKIIKWFINGSSSPIHESKETNHTFDLTKLPLSENIFKIAIVGVDNSGNVSDTAFINLVINPGKPEIITVYKHTDMLSDIKSEIDQNSVVTYPVKNKIILSCYARDINVNSGFVEQVEWSIKKSSEDDFVNSVKLPYEERYETSRENPGIYTIKVNAIDNDKVYSDPFIFTVKIE